METTQIRSAVALLLAVALTGGIVLILERLAPGLTTGTAMRTSNAWPEAAASQYQSLGDVWFAVRVLLGLYITVVATMVSFLVLIKLRDVVSGPRVVSRDG